MNINFRTESNKILIATLLKEIQDLKEEMTLWQQSALGRIIHRAYIIQIQNGQFTVESPFEIFNGFVGKEALYLHTEYKQITFKVAHFVFDKNKLVLPFPKEVRAKELRKIPRIVLSQEFTTPELAFFKNKAFDAGTIEFSFKLHDISEFGLAFIIPRGSLTKVSKGDELYFDHLGEHKLGKTVKGKIMHISPMLEGDSFSSQYYKVGVQFDQVISLENLSFLKPYLK
jgi:hypothetical protein